MKIYAPNKNANGIYASTLFVNGVGETTNPALIHWFKTHGYRVEESVVEAPKAPLEKVTEILETEPMEDITLEVEVPKNEDGSINFEAMTPNEIREWGKANGYGSQIGNLKNKEKLISIVRG